MKLSLPGLKPARGLPGCQMTWSLTLNFSDPQIIPEVVGQRKLLKWSLPGAAHAATFWGFIVS